MNYEMLKTCNDGNSCESDFEIINNSDSETELNGYIQFDSSQNHTRFYTENVKYLKDLNTIEPNPMLKIENTKKLRLSLSQEQIILLTQNKNTSRNEIVKKSSSSNFPNLFKLVPIDINIRKNILSSSHSINLPEIVLTSYDNKESNDCVVKKTENFDIEQKKTYLISQNENNILNDQLNTSGKGEKSNPISNVYNETILAASPSFMTPLDFGRISPYAMSIDSNHPSSLTSPAPRLNQLMFDPSQTPVPYELKCLMCNQLYKDPRTLNCLHSFCFQCLINENFGKEASIPFWSRPDGNQFQWESSDSSRNSNSQTSSDSDPVVLPRPESRSSFTSFRSRKSNNKLTRDLNCKNSLEASSAEKLKILICNICQYCTAIPVGGIRHVPKNMILARKVENLLLKVGSELISSIWCSLCCDDMPASYHCISCTINLCNFCKEAHERQKSTANHSIKNITDLRRTKNNENDFITETKKSFRCSLHPGFELTGFCMTCQQITCTDCNLLLHKEHKCETLLKAYRIYQKLIKEKLDRTKPLNEYATHSISKLSVICKKVNEKCDQVQNEVETHIRAYFQAVEVHRRTLLQQITRARETKIQIIIENQTELEKKTSDVKSTIAFIEELFQYGNEVELLSFGSILIKRLEFCQKLKPTLDQKISETLHFFPELRAPSTKAQNNIPLYGIITTQIVEPKFCTLETEGYNQVRVHQKSEFVILSRDTDGIPLCHGGFNLNATLKYKDATSRQISTNISDMRDGTYLVSFVPDAPGTMILTVHLNNKQIKGSPFVIIARTLRPHSGIFHCCAFCSSKGSKNSVCACDGIMPAFKGCGHGHNGHPGRRHWSCCASTLENSECQTANKF